jgi:chemotaxis protein MotB
MSLNRKQRRPAKNGEGSWAVSYVDMLTLLLCFFIIFYSNTQNRPDESVLQKIAFDLSGQPAALAPKAGGTDTANGGLLGIGHGAGNGTGTATGEGTMFGSNLWGKAAVKGNGNISVSPEDLALLELIKTRLMKDLPASIKSTEKSLEINFEGISFFQSGKTKLLPEAEVQIGKVINLLGKYKDIVRITVQGHTDPSKISASKKNFSDNWELSVLRATSVLKLFLKNGFSQEMLSAEGFADTRVNRAIAEYNAEELSKLRRITLRIEPVQVKK